MMKKYTLFFAFFVFSFCAFSAQLNPFAYGLSSELSADQSTLTVHYSLNAPATGVKVLVMNGNTVVAEKDCNSLGLTKGNYTTTISTTDFPTDTDLTWKVEVKGTSVEEPTQVDDSYSFWCPQGVAIDKDPNSNYFGRILVSEAMQAVPASGYISSGKGAGLYVFNPDFTTDQVVHKGGLDFTRILADKGYQPWRVKISDDGRIFVSSLDLNGVAVWEVSKDLQTWTPVISGTNGTDYKIIKNDVFFAGPNCAMDVIGSGGDLKLLLYSTSKGGIAFDQSGYRLDEYALGTATTFTGTPKNIIDGGKYAVVHSEVDFIYDGEGGYWFGGGRGNNKDSEPNLVHITAKGEQDCKETSDDYYGGGGLMVYKGMLFKGLKRETETNGKFGVYSIGKNASGKTTLTKKWTVVSKGLGRNHNQFAVDYADNLYVVGNSKEKIIAFALPYSGTSTTPAAKKYAFEITKPNYDHPENHLAPFAYDLRTTTTGEGGRTKLHFMLNAHAKRVQVWLIDEETKNEILLRDYPNEKSDPKDFVPYHPEGYGTVITTEDVEALNLEYGKNYSWRVDVWGKEVTSSNCVRSYDFFHPSAVDIDNNPENPRFGMILTNECQQKIKGLTGLSESGTSYSDFLGNNVGAGVYAFTADFKPIKNANGQYGFNGGRTFSTSDTHLAPRRIRISDDGRIFATAQDGSGEYLWEINPEEMNEWTSVFRGTNSGYTLKDASGNFIAGTNSGFDVRGKGDYLQLLMLSASLPGGQIASFKCHIYNLGTATTWTTAPTKEVAKASYMYVTSQSNAQFDKDGGVWYIQWRSTTTDQHPGLVHVNKDGVEDYKELRHETCNAGFRFNHDFTKVVIAGNKGERRKATIYRVSKDANGVPVLTEERVVDMSHVGQNLNDFAWDYAGNLYVCSNSNEKVAAYVMPRSANDKVSTPAREEYMVNLTQPVPRIVAYNLTYRPNGAKKTYDFSFYVNTKPNAGGVIRFYKNDDAKTQLFEYSITKDLIQGDNTVSIPMATLDAALNYEKDITWELTLSAPDSQVFGKIYKSGELNTAYATINTNPATDYFGHVYAGNQQDHVSTGSGGNIYVWAPGSGTNNNQGDRYHTIQTAFTPKLSPNDKNGFTQVSAPGIAPDGKVYFTDNGKDGGVYVMDPKDYSITSFFKGLEQNGIAQYLYKSSPVGTPSSSAHIYWTGGNTAKLFLVSTEYGEKYNVGSMNMDLSRYNAGYYIYPLTEQDGQWTHDWGKTQRIAVTEDNIYQPNFTIVGTSHGAWYCQHRRNDWDVKESRSLMFFGNDGERKYCSTDEDVIYGSCGSAIAVNKEETLLAMASGLGGIMFFDIAWDGDVPTLTHKYSCALNYNDVVTTLNFDYNGNLVATVGDSYNDKSDKHRMVVFTMPDMGKNTVTVPARFSQRVAALYADERMPVHFDQVEKSPYQTVDVFRQLQAGMYNTICLPFALETLENTPWKGSTVMKFVGTEHDATANLVYMNFSEVDFTPGNIMEAGMPYLIWPKEEVVDLARISPVWRSNDFTNEGKVVDGVHATFQGVINPTELKEDPSIFFLVANNRLATPTAKDEMMGMRAYFQLKQPLGDNTKAVITVEHKSPTNVDVVPSGTHMDATRKILQDQKIFIIRDGKIYNILGESVKTNEIK